MKIVLLCDSQPNQVALANKIAAEFHVAGIVIEERKNVKKSGVSVSQLVEKILNRTVFVSIRNAWFDMMYYYKKKYPAFPATASITVNSINSDETSRFIDTIKPDLVMVSGTSILKKKLLSMQVPLGIINLHTGLSPYIKGGPNCTNWCLAENKIHLIGNTVMWIDAGIDSGDLISTSTTPFTGHERLSELHIKVMDHAHTIYLDAVKKIAENPATCPRVKQSSIATGITFYSKDWNWRKKMALLKHLKRLPAYIKSGEYLQQKAAVITVELL